MNEKMDFKEHLALEVKQKIDNAKANAILESRLDVLEKEMVDYAASPGDESYKKEDQIEQEILASSAVAKDITEFREVLRQIQEELGYTNDWTENLLAHENAHANVAQQTGHPWVGYTTLFIKDESNRIVSIQPAFFTKSDRNWGEVETLVKNMMVTDAPSVYGNSPSEFDVESLRINTEKLEALEKTDAEEVARVKKSLGMN
jgi:hypothetical protein